jgi:hypothetical protein
MTIELRTIWLSALSLTLLACKGDGSDETGTGTTGTASLTVPDTATDGTGPTTPTSTTGDPVDTSGTGGSSTVDPSESTSSTGDETTQGVETVATTQTTDITTIDSTGPDDTSTTSSTTSTSTTTDTTDTEGTTDSTTTGDPEPPSDIDVIITADNAYAFAYGTDDNVSQYFGGEEAMTAGQIFNCGEGPEHYTVPAADADNATYLYVVAWDDSAVTNGVLARFRRMDDGGGFGTDVYTGTPGWEACATGQQYQIGSGGPDLATINEYIVKCNAGNLDPGTTSVGWVDEVGTQFGAVAFGEDNTTPYANGPQPGNEFPLTCPAEMPAEARWMWFDWDTTNPASPFLFPGGQNPYHQFLLFRFAAEKIPIPQ